MKLAVISAFGVGGATIFGVILGFIFNRVSHKFNDSVLGFAAGIMLASAILGLVVPSLEEGNVWITLAGIICGAFFLNCADKLTPHLHNISADESSEEIHPEKQKNLDKVLLFVIAIAIHNFPEGIAAGVGFGTENIGNAITVALGIALQNIPEGMIIVSPLIMAGAAKRKVFFIACFTGVIEIAGTMIGYGAVNIATVILPFALAFAGGTMIYVVSDEMIPETHSHGYERLATYALLIGFMAFVLMDFYIG